MKIVVLAGGYSPERDVSLCSGSLIANALIEEGHKVLLLDSYIGAGANKDEFKSLFIDKSENKKYEYKVSESEPSLDELKKDTNNGEALIGENVLELCKYADIVFIALHGGIGENGQLQAMFDIMGIKYTGTGYAGSLLAMDKNLSKKVFINEGIPTASYIYFNVKKDNVNKIQEEIGLPCVVKPCSHGSSSGISIANNEAELTAAIDLATKYEEEILIEKYIKGREITVGILDGEYLPPIEIIPKEGFFDYKNKYQAGLTDEICPAHLSKEETEKVGKLALKVHSVLQLGSYSRQDFIYDGNEFFCLEANTLPGMTPTSLLPQSAKAVGIEYNELCSKIINMAL